MKKYKIAVAGLGYVGLSQAVLLAQKNDVTAYDTDADRVSMVNRHISPVQDSDIQKYLDEKNLQLEAVSDSETAYSGADFVVIAVPTDYDEVREEFDTSKVEAAAAEVRSCNKDAFIVIKSTVPIGYTDELKEKTGDRRILFSPEFLRETKALHDNLYPNRIIVGTDTDDEEMCNAADVFVGLLEAAAIKETIDTFVMDSSEAEAVKLFSNMYLAMRVSFFNELDTFAESMGMNTRNIINGVCADERIGNYYNNPSFGYGGYCLPKDTKQLLKQYADIPQSLMHSVVDANAVRKKYIADRVLSIASEKQRESGMTETAPVIGIYRLIMKTGSDNFRSSAVRDVMAELMQRGVDIIIFEPDLSEKIFAGCKVEGELKAFKEQCNVIIANRIDDDIADVKDKVYTRDVFNRD